MQNREGRKSHQGGLLSKIPQGMTSAQSYAESWSTNNGSCYPDLRLSCWAFILLCQPIPGEDGEWHRLWLLWALPVLRPGGTYSARAVLR